MNINDVIADDFGNQDANGDGTANDPSPGGSLEKSGAGTTNLNAANTYVGPTTITGGLLNVNGSITSDVTVNGGALGGSGTVFGDAVANAGGAIAPGAAPGSLGILSVNGNVTFQPGSFFDVEVDAAGNSDRLQVGGTATLNGGTVRVTTIDPDEAYADGQTYLILDAPAGRTGEFAGATDDSAFLDFLLTYNTTSVFLILQRIEDETGQPITFPAVAETFNQRQAASGLARFDQTPGSDALFVFNNLLLLSAEDARRAFDLASGELHASLQHTTLDISDLYLQALQRRAALVAGSTAPEFSLAPLAYSMGGRQGALPAHVMAADLPEIPVEPMPQVVERRILSAWVAGLGETGEISDDGNAAELEHDVYGVAGGLDGNWTLWDGLFVAGISGGYTEAEADVDARLSSAEIESGHVGLYAAWDNQTFRLSGAAAYAAHDIETERRIAFAAIDRTATANYHADTLALAGEAAWRVAWGGSYFGPLASVDALFGEHDGAEETGADALNLEIASEDFERTEAGIGLMLGTEWAWGTALWEAEARVLYEHAFGDDVPAQSLAFAGAPGADFTVLGPERAEDFLTAGLGLGVSLTETFNLTADYEGSFADESETHKGHLSLNYRF